MGANKPTVRTLPTGEKVTHHPDGRQVLIPTNTMAERLAAQQQQFREASRAQSEALVQAALDKRKRQDDGDTVPSDKRIV